MIGNIITDKDGKPVDGNGKVLSKSSYNPPDEIKRLFGRVQNDYQVAWALQNQPFDEFDGYSLLERARMDQETFGAFVGAEYVPAHKQWRWRGRKNTARNLIIGILAHVIAGMLFPFVEAYNEEDEEDKMTAKVMQILIENHLKRAGYEIKFLYMMCSALVNPAVFVQVEYIEAMQRIKIRRPDGSYRVEEAVDELLSGLNLNIWPIDSVLLGDFFTFDVQKQPYIIKIRRIPYDQARSECQGKYIIDGKDQFDYVMAGKTRVWMAGEDGMTLYDVDWTEADQNYVQELTIAYRSEDLEVKFVGGVFLGTYANDDVYNCNPFKHRRMSMIKDEWMSIPVYDMAKSGFEPLDPQMRFAYYKSAAFKEYWDDASQNHAYQLAQDGMTLDVIKPIFMSGVAKVDSTVMVPGATIAMPQGAQVTPYQLGPNLAAALDIMRVNKEDLSLSTQDPQQSGIAEKGVTATASIKAEQNAKIILSGFSVLIADLVKQIGELAMDCIIMHTTVGEVDATVPDALKMKFRRFMFKGKEAGKDVTNKVEFSSDMYDLSPEQANELEWKIFEKNNGMEATTYEYKVNAYKFARYRFGLYVDAQMIVSRSMGTDQLRKDRALQILTSPQVAPFVNQEAVVDKFVLEEYSDGDPDQFKRKVQPGEDPNALLNATMGMGSNPQQNKQPVMMQQ